MADIKTKESRSYNMSRIAGKDTKPEELVRKYLFSKGFRYRKNYKNKKTYAEKMVLETFRLPLVNHIINFYRGVFSYG